MEIYVVQAGDTIASIASKYGVTADQLIISNGILEPFTLVIGQTLVITYPVQVYTVKEGDSLEGIAEAYQVSVMQLLRNNPQLANRQYIYPGEILAISYDNNNGSLLVAGYTYPFIREEVLRSTLPYLTYLVMFSNRITAEGEFVGSDEDVAVIQTAKLYDTAVTLVVTAYSERGDIDPGVVFTVLSNNEIQEKLVSNVLSVVREKGYQGVNLSFQLINEENQELYLNFLTNVWNSLHPAGYLVFLTLNPGLKYENDEVSFEMINYTQFSDVSDGILFLSYDWGSLDRPPIQYSIITTKSLLDYIVAQVPLDKIRIEMPTLGYDWQLPFVEGRSKANTLNYDSVLALASQMNAIIQYDEDTLSAYFEYTDIMERRHIVWFKDARSVDSTLKILKSYGIKGVGVWNIMYFFHQMWLVMNTQYQIEKVL